MSGNVSNCANCGARLDHSADGRVVACAYCGSATSVAVDPHALAASIAADARTVAAGFDGLLSIFRQTLPAQTVVMETGLVFKKVTAFDVSLDEYTFRLSRQGEQLIAQRATTVGGIRLRNETLPLEAWLRSLAEKLAEMAGQSAAARDAFARLPGAR